MCLPHGRNHFFKRMNSFKKIILKRLDIKIYLYICKRNKQKKPKMKKLPKDVLIIHTDKNDKRTFVTNENIIEKIGKNANKVISEAIKLEMDYMVMKFRKYGKIEIWVK